MIISVSEYIAKFLRANDVSFVYELSGGMIMHLMVAIQQEPMLLEVCIDQGVNVYPKIAFGRPISEMEPFASPIAMEAT
jgi:thiamine pyrophosphate-dependent acetolactate synthase large subunit-like protein